MPDVRRTQKLGSKNPVVPTAFARLVQPSVVAIYLPHPRRDSLLNQIGTGFLVAYEDRPVLITARHTLRGHNDDENPADRAIQVGSDTVFIGAVDRVVVGPEGRDLSMLFMDEFPLDRCLSLKQIAPNPVQPQFVTFGGYLARDFKRDGETLRPAPRTYTNIGVSALPGMVTLKHPKRRNIDSDTGAPVVAPRPSGLSGGPMLDTRKLIVDEVSVVGVFTRQERGQATGESAAYIGHCLQRLADGVRPV